MERERFFNAVNAALGGGVDAVLVREKQMDSARLLAFCARLRVLTRAHGARLIVHGQADVAKAVNAEGVHMAARNMGQIQAMRAWLNDFHPDFSVSCHSVDEMDQAAGLDAEFVFLSPVFPTSSHPGAPHLGVEQFRMLAKSASLPVIALGGITQQNRRELSGFGVAVISAILDTDDPEDAARRLKNPG